ncbi:MAG TPA: phage tail tube protein [Blastocatellia bacterium]|jgi:hypothetical protein
MATPRRGQVRIAHSSTFASESSFGTALSNGAIDKTFNLTPENPRFEIVTQDDRVLDCSGQFLSDEVVLARYCRLSFGIELDAATLWGLIKWGFGVVASSEATLLGPTSFQPPATSFIYGHDGSSVNPLKLKAMVLASLRITGRVAQRLSAQVEFRGHGNPAAATGYTFPECSAITPIYLKDCAFSLAGADRYADLREFDFNFSNELISEDDPFTLASPDITRMERGDIRQYGWNLKLLGEPNDSTHQSALAKTKVALSHRLGTSTENVTLDVASGVLKQAGGPGYDGRANRSVLDLALEPVKVSGNADTPILATRTTP